MKRMWFDLCFYIGTIALGGLRRENDVAEEDQEDFEEDHARASSKKIDWTAFQTPLRPHQFGPVPRSSKEVGKGLVMEQLQKACQTSVEALRESKMAAREDREKQNVLYY